MSGIDALPTSFKLLGYTWRIEYRDEAFTHDSGTGLLHGGCDLEGRLIIVNRGQEPLAVLHAFLHELLHATLDAIGKRRLGDDEAFVDTLSGALAQALFTLGEKDPAQPAGAALARKTRSRRRSPTSGTRPPRS